MTPSQAPGFFQSLLFSAFNFHFYPRIQHQSFGRSFRYLLLLACALSLLVSYRLYTDFSRNLADWSLWLKQNLPVIRVDNGVASTVPTEGKRIEDSQAVLVLEPESPPAPIDPRYRAGLVLSRDKLLLKWNQAAGPVGEASRVERLVYAVAYLAYVTVPDHFRGNEVSLAGIRSLRVDPDAIAQWESLTRRLARVTLPVVYFLFYLMGKLLQALFFSVVLGYTSRTLRESGFGFGSALNVAIYALTPPAIFAAIVQAAGLQVPFLEWVFLGMYVAFLLGALNACVPKKTPEPKEDQGPGDWGDF